MSRKMTSAEFQRREFEKEIKKQLILIFQGPLAMTEEVALKRSMRAYNIAEMRTALREEQQGGE